MQKPTKNATSCNDQLTLRINQLSQLLGATQQILASASIVNNTLEKSNNISSKFTKFIYKSLQSFIFWTSIGALSIGYANTPDNSINRLSKMSCKELLEKLVKTSSYGTIFMNKKNNMGFYSERSDNDRIALTFVTNAFSPQEMIYANSEIDLISGTLKMIDPENPILIDVNKQYIPYIANKCTPDKNEYRRGKYPDPEYDGIFIERHERWKHPVLAVFEKHGFLLNKVSYSIDGKFPTFYIVLKYPQHMAFDSKATEKIYFEIIKANSNFPYAIVEQNKNIRVNVGWSDKEKKLIKIKINRWRDYE